MATTHDTTETNKPQAERDDKGRFGKGNRGGPGNPFARQTARLRQAMLDAVTEEDIRAAIGALKEKARQGDVAAIKLLLSYGIGKPGAAPDPDTLDQHEFATIQNNHTATVQSVINIVEGMPMDALLLILRAMLPALLDSKLKMAAEIFSQPAEEDEGEDEEDEEDEDEAAAAEAANPLENIPDWMREIANKEAARQSSPGAAARSDHRAAAPAQELPKSSRTAKAEKPMKQEALNHGDAEVGSGAALNPGAIVDAELLRILIGRLGGTLGAQRDPIGNGSNGKNGKSESNGNGAG